MQFFKTPNLNFVGARKQALIISLILIVAGIISVALHGGLKQSIDFTGGTIVEVRFDQPVPLQEIRDIVDWPPASFTEDDKLGEQDGYVFTDINTVVNAFYYQALVLKNLSGF